MNSTAYRPRSAWYIAGAVVLVCLAGALMNVRESGLAAWSSLWPLLLIAYLSVWFFYYPSLSVQSTEVQIRNPLRSIVVPFECIQSIDTRYTLSLHTAEGIFRAWAAPAGGVVSRYTGGAENVPHAKRRDAAGIAVSELTHTPSGAVAELVRWHFERYQVVAEQGNRGGSRDSEEQRVQVKANIPWLLGCAVLVVFSTVSVLAGS